MTALQPRCGSLSKWTLQENGFRQSLDRRAVFGSALAAGAAALLLKGRPASAWTVEAAPPAMFGAIPERDGVLPWRILALTEVEYGQKPKFPAVVQELDGHPVVIEGHMMPLEDDERLQRFLLTRYNAHCPFCMPGGAVSLVAVTAEAEIRATDKQLIMRGTLRLISESAGNLIYRLEHAATAV
jgi:hypothetical protein